MKIVKMILGVLSCFVFSLMLSVSVFAGEKDGVIISSGEGKYYENGKANNKYTGYANDYGNSEKNYKWYVKNGIVDKDYEGLYKVDGVWRYYRYGKFQSTTTGFATDMTRYNSQKRIYRYRIEKGLINFHFTGMAETGAKRYYEDGRWMNTTTKYVVVGQDRYRIKNGVIDETFEGLYKDDGLNWRYYRYGKFQRTTTGFASNSIGRFRIEKGIINWKYAGIADSNRYYKDGRWQSQYTGYLTSDSEPYLYEIKNGKVIGSGAELEKGFKSSCQKINSSLIPYCLSENIDKNITFDATVYYVIQSREIDEDCNYYFIETMYDDTVVIVDYNYKSHKTVSEGDSITVWGGYFGDYEEDMFFIYSSFVSIK